MTEFYRISLLRVKALSWLLILTIVLCLPSGCLTISSVNHLRQAQETFNKAASIENQSRFDPKKETELNANIKSSEGLTSAQSGYAAALVILRRMPDEEKEALKKEKLMGVKLTLEGLVLWRLGKYKEALDITDQVERDAKGQIYPRDSIIIRALPDLIKIDLAKTMIQEAEYSNNEEKKKVLNKVVPLLVEMDTTKASRHWSAVQHIKAIRQKLNKTHPIHSYLIQAQLAAYRNYKVAFTSISDSSHKFVPDDDKYKKEASYNLKDLEVLITKLEKPEISAKLKRYWAIRCNIKPEETTVE